MSFNYKSKEFYINLDKNDIPPKNHPDYLALRDWERKKCKEGVIINGIHIWGSLYYHLNHFKTDIDYLDNQGNIVPKIEVPSFRDNEWLIHEAYNNSYTVDLKEGLIVGSGRQVSKTTTQVSLVTRQLFLFQNSEVLGLFLNKPDKETFTKKLLVALQNVTEFLTVPNIDKDLNKEYIRFGITQKDNEPFVYSKLYMYLTSGGVNTEIGAGKTVNMFFVDECAKGNVIEAHEAVLPAINSKFGMRCSPFYTATGGNLEKSKDFESMFFNPETYKFKAFDNENKKTGFFLGGWYRSDFKKESNFTDWYNKKYNTNIDSDNELTTVKYYETDFELANKTLDFEEEKAKETSLLAWQKRKMYYPRTLGDMFLKVEQNPFSKFIDEFEKLLKFLETQELKKVDFETNGKPIDSSKKPLFDYPYNKNEIGIFDTPLCVVDEPRLISGTKLYVGGLDPYNTIKTAESASLGSFYIMRRETSDYSDSYNSRIVAWYNGRKDITSFRKLLTNTLLYYGVEQGCVTMLHEAADDNLTQHYTEKNKGYYLEDTYTLSREINPNSTSFNSKGLRPTPRTQAYYLQLILDYCEEELEDGRLGLWRIPDPYLIKQLMNFDGDLSDKDSLVSFGHALIHLKKESKYRPNVSERVEVKEKPKVINNAFGNSFKTYKKSAI